MLEFIKLATYDFKGRKGEQVKCSKIRLKDYNLDICTSNPDVFELPLYARFTAEIQASTDKVQNIVIKELL